MNEENRQKMITTMHTINENRQKMIAAMHIINEICIEGDCTDCPFYKNCGSPTPAWWEIPKEEEK